jgi:hypothetical protein
MGVCLPAGEYGNVNRLTVICSRTCGINRHPLTILIFITWKQLFVYAVPGLWAEA